MFLCSFLHSSSFATASAVVRCPASSSIYTVSFLRPLLFPAPPDHCSFTLASLEASDGLSLIEETSLLPDRDARTGFLPLLCVCLAYVSPIPWVFEQPFSLSVGSIGGCTMLAFPRWKEYRNGPMVASFQCFLCICTHTSKICRIHKFPWKESCRQSCGFEWATVKKSHRLCRNFALVDSRYFQVSSHRHDLRGVTHADSGSHTACFYIVC